MEQLTIATVVRAMMSVSADPRTLLGITSPVMWDRLRAEIAQMLTINGTGGGILSAVIDRPNFLLRGMPVIAIEGRLDSFEITTLEACGMKPWDAIAMESA